MGPSTMKFCITLIIVILLIASSIAQNEPLPEPERTPTNIPDTRLNTPCDTAVFEKYAAVHLTQATNVRDYKTTYEKMKKEINNTMYNSTDVCFHNRYFLECSIDIKNNTCQCATGGVWKNYNYTKVGDECRIGKGGRCHLDKKLVKHFKCVDGTKCIKAGEYGPKKPKYKCSGSESSIYQIQKLTLWVIFVWVALLWKE